MRNLFDQYSQPENRLTHALAVCLSEDRRLLASWLKWIGLSPSTKVAILTIVAERLPTSRPRLIVTTSAIKKPGSQQKSTPT